VKNRSANDSIKGYVYQFDASILTILKLPSDSDTVEIEGIEDIDIYRANSLIACQYKYYEGTEYNHSVIAEAIRAMISDYSSRKKAHKDIIKYQLIGHYKCGTDKLPDLLTVAFVKEHFLTYHKENKLIKHYEDISVTDTDIDEFLRCVSINIKAQTFDEQRFELISVLQQTYNCDEIEAELYYYNSAISNLIQIACRKNNRSIQKASFCRLIDKKEIILNKWLVAFKGGAYWIRLVRNKIRPGINLCSFQRIFLFDISSFDLSSSEIARLIIELHKCWSSNSKREPHPFSPLFYFHGLKRETILNVKITIVENNYDVIDGHPFLDAPFIETSLLAEPLKGAIYQIKILNTIDDILKISEKSNKIIEYYEVFVKDRFTELTPQKGAFYSIGVESIEQIREIFL
jgi:hypothetical protein